MEDEHHRMRPRWLASYYFGRALKPKKPAVKGSKTKSDAHHSHYLEKNFKEITVTRDFDKISVDSPATPPRGFSAGMRPDRSATHRRASTMKSSSPPPSSPMVASAAAIHVDGTQFIEDPRWWKSIFTHIGPDSRTVGVFENDAGVKNRATPSLEILTKPSFVPDHAETQVSPEDLGQETVAEATGIIGKPKDSQADSDKRLSCAPVHTQKLGIGRSASQLKARIAYRGWPGSKAPLMPSVPGELTQNRVPGRVAIPRQITVRRKQHQSKHKEESRIGSGLEGQVTQSRNTLRIVQADGQGRQSKASTQDPELAAMLHDPNQNRFSDDWAKSCLQGIAGDGHQVPADIVSFPRKVALERSISVNPVGISGGEKVTNLHTKNERHSDAAGDPDILSSYTIDLTATQMLVPPKPGPRTSSKTGFFAKFGTGKPPPCVSSPFTDRGRPCNAPTRGTESGSSFTEDFGCSGNPTVSTDTLVKIEDEAQAPPRRPVFANFMHPPFHFKKLSLDSGPPSRPPARALPQLPKADSQKEARSSISSRTHHSRKQSTSCLGHVNDKLSVSSGSTVRGLSPRTNVSQFKIVQNEDRRSQSGVSQHAGLIEGMDVISSKNIRSRSPTSIYSQGFKVQTAAKTTEKDAARASRPERVRIIKQRDLKSHSATQEADESNTFPPLTIVTDPLDQLPNLVNSRPRSRTSARRAHSAQRAQSSALRVRSRMLASQLLTLSDITVVENARPITPKLKTGRRSRSSQFKIADSPLRENFNASLRLKSEYNLPKAASHRSIRSHVSASTLAVNGELTPPSLSDSSASDHYSRADSRRMDALSMRRDLDRTQHELWLMWQAIRRLGGLNPSQEHRHSQTPISVPSHRGRAPKTLMSPIGMKDASPGPAATGDPLVDSAEDGLEASGASREDDHRFSGAPPVAKMYRMLDQMASTSTLSVATICKDPVRVEMVDDEQEGIGHQEKIENGIKVPSGGRLLWSRC